MTDISEETEQIDPGVLIARKQATQRLLDEAKDAQLSADIYAVLANHPDHPADENLANEQQELANQKKQAAEESALAVGIDPEKHSKTARFDNLRAQLKDWKRLRAIHVDMVANPHMYGGVDLGGTPLDMDDQRRMIAEYDTAISAVEKELEG